MTTRETIERYFDRLKQKRGWESLLTDDFAFSSFTSPIREINGRDAYLHATRRFFSMITDVELRELMVEGERACALTRYRLAPPNGAPAFGSDVAEVFSVKEGGIASLSI